MRIAIGRIAEGESDLSSSTRIRPGLILGGWHFRYRQSEFPIDLEDLAGLELVRFVIAVRRYRTLKRCLSIRKLLIFVSRVDLGIPSLAAAPVGPATRPPHSAKADSISSFSCSAPKRPSPLAALLDHGASVCSQTSSTDKVWPSHKITALSITFCSSRILPGQWYA